MKLTRVETKYHQEAEQILFGSDKALSDEQVLFVLENWRPGAENNITANAAFFTPIDLSVNFAVAIGLDRGRVVDMGSGIGSLLYGLKQYGHGEWLYREVVAVEINPQYVEVGSRLFPDVVWLNRDVFDQSLWEELGSFDLAICNPPFGQVDSKRGLDTSWLRYSGPADLMFAEVALRVANLGGSFILPKTHVPWEWEGGHLHYKTSKLRDLDRFEQLFPYVNFGTFSIQVDEDYEWKGASPRVELVDITLDDCPYRMLPLDRSLDPVLENGEWREPSYQLSLF